MIPHPPPTDQPAAPGRLASTVLAFAVVLTVAAAAVALAGRLLPILAPWHRVLGVPVNPTLSRVLAALAVILLFLAGCRLLWRAPAWLYVLWGIAGALAVRMAVLALAGEPLPLIFACATGNCSGGFSLGLETGSEMLRGWPALMPELRGPSPHLAISAPGWPFLYWKLTQAMERLPAISDGLANALRPLGCDWWEFNGLSDAQVASAWLGVSAPLWSALTAAPLYLLARRAGGETTARGALLWWPLIPVAALFAASPSLTYALPATAVVALLWAGLDARRPPARVSLIGAAGLLMGATLVLTFSVAPLLLLCGALILCHAVQLTPGDARAIGRRALTGGVAFGLGLLLVYLGYLLLAGHSLLTVFRTAMGLHLDSGAGLSYLESLGLNAWDFVLFAGIPLCALAAGVGLVRRARGVTCLAVALGLTLAALLLSGSARGEVARVWAYFTPFVTLLAAATWGALSRGQRGLTVAAQVLLLMAIAARFTPEGTPARPVPSYADVAGAPLAGAERAADARFGDELRLVGYQSEQKPGARSLTVSLRWQALRRNDRPYYFSAVLVGPDDRALPGVVWQPLATRYPTTCWAPGESVIDRIELPLPPAAPAGDWWLSLSAFALAGEAPAPNLPVALPGGARDTQVGLGPLRVEAP